MTSKVFIVTGASKGIGAAITQYLISQSHKVIMAARSQDLLEKTKQAHLDQVDYVAGDMTNQEIPGKLVALAIEKFGRLDGMVINHGMLENAHLSATTMESFRHQFDVNVFSCLALAQAGLQEIKKAKGAIIWISSGASVKTYKAWGTYGATKAALNAVSSHMAVEEPDITSVAIQPGRVNTGMQALIRDTGKGVMDDKAYATFIEAYNTDDLLKPEQPGSVIARVVANPSKELSGKFMPWNSPDLAAYQE